MLNTERKVFLSKIDGGSGQNSYGIEENVDEDPVNRIQGERILQQEGAEYRAADVLKERRGANRRLPCK